MQEKSSKAMVIWGLLLAGLNIAAACIPPSIYFR